MNPLGELAIVALLGAIQIEVAAVILAGVLVAAAAGALLGVLVEAAYLGLVFEISRAAEAWEIPPYLGVDQRRYL